jgi:hypothetical protein
MIDCTREEFREELIETIKEGISFDEIGKFLPFQTRIIAGSNYDHIQSQSVWAQKTETRTILDGDTLCGRRSFAYSAADRLGEPCPGCEAIGKGLAVRDLL